MVTNFDHVTLVVQDVEEAKDFFELLGFLLEKSVVISGTQMDSYMGVPGLEADHITLVIPESDPRQEIQLLHYHHPAATDDLGSGVLSRTGFNHVCFRVTDLDAEVTRLVAKGVELRNEPMIFHDRKLVFLRGPCDVVVELAEWL
ncbi:MAG TPA: VOC family protein, partial [Acidimicrobiales bacterium]|nr:VOC family protein [Acidimicrobiales bacterium]